MDARLRAVVLAAASMSLTLMPTHVLKLDAEQNSVAPSAQPAAAPMPTPTAAPADFPTWLVGVRREALERGITQPTVDAALTGLEPEPTVINRDRAQAEIVLSVDEYLRRRLTRSFIR